jgi:hypothetical protein
VRSNAFYRWYQVFGLCVFYYFLANSTNAQELDTYGGFTDVTGKKPGFFHTKKIDGRWWLVTPEFTSPEKR